MQLGHFHKKSKSTLIIKLADKSLGHIRTLRVSKHMNESAINFANIYKRQL